LRKTDTLIFSPFTIEEFPKKVDLVNSVRNKAMVKTVEKLEVMEDI
jgi:hypothetical protein